MIRFDKVTKAFPSGITAVENLSFTVGPGEFMGITGPSGAGKTTVLKLLIQEIPPTSGTITVSEIEVGKLKPKDLPKLRRTVAAVFQDFKILEDQTAAENVALVNEILGIPLSGALSAAVKILAQVGLGGKENLFPRQLSGGELQRVAIARALAIKPKILFADEPTGNLDIHTAAAIMKLIKDINSAGTTVLVASHDDQLLKRFTDKLLRLEKGKMVK
jgi:cell division transport system ATP-binding protein